MTRGTLAANTIALASLALAPAAFSAAVVHNGALIGLPHDTGRLRAGAKLNLASAPLSLWIARPDSRHTLTGVSIDTGASDVTLPDISTGDASLDEKACPALAANVGMAAAPAPAPAAENLGSASSFGAVPEPSSAVLLVLGAASLLRRRRK